MKKDIKRIRRKRLDRWFYFKPDPKHPTLEKWLEGGHLISGVAIDLGSTNEINGLGRFEERCGYFVDGEMEHAQNTTGDLSALQKLEGTVSFAFLCKDQLEIFRVQKIKDQVFDNRISFQTSGAGYNENRENSKSKLSGFIRGYEKYFVHADSVKITNGRLKYKINTDVSASGLTGLKKAGVIDTTPVDHPGTITFTSSTGAHKVSGPPIGGK